MSSTVNNGISFVPENTIDPAAGLNLALNQIDPLLQLAVVSVGTNTPPGSPANGARYIVGTAPTGAWASRANQVAQWLDGAWRFFTTARYALNLSDGLWYVRQASTWVSLAGGAPTWGSITGAIADQTDLQAALDGKVGTADTRLTDAREWTADTVTQAEAEAGTATTRRAWTAQRVRQAVAAWWNSVSSAWGRGFVAAADAAAGRTTLGLAAGNSPTFTALTLTNGQIVFPATQVPSANANTLDDYEEGTWTPVLTFATPGDLSVTYSQQSGSYTKIGRVVSVDFTLITTSFTHTTAAGSLTFTGLPFNAALNNIGNFDFQGITKSGYTHFVSRITQSTANLTVQASASALARSTVMAADTPTGGALIVLASIQYNAV